MKANQIIGGRLLLLALAALSFQPATALAQGTAFSYQGRLNAGGNPANGSYDLQFMVFDALTGGNLVAGPLTNSPTGVTNGLFTVALDFGSDVFTGSARWLDVAVRTNGNGAFTTLLPRQPLLPTPYSVMAGAASNLLGTLPAVQVSGTLPPTALAGYSGTVAFTNSGNLISGSFTGSFSGNGTGLTNVSGYLSWQNITTTSQPALPNTGYLANNAAPVTIILPTAPSLGSRVRVAGVGTGGWIIAQNAGQSIQTGAITAGYTNWNSLTNWSPTSAPGQNWYAIAASADGTRLAAAVYGGGIWTSTSSGANWTQTSVANASWVSIASSADGTRLVAVAQGGGIATSVNSGGTWTLTSSPLNWSSVASSADGTNLAAVVYGGNIYTSTNSGTNWTLITTSPTYNWISIASSADGTRLVAAAYGSGLFTSPNSGVSWMQTPASTLNWWSVASSADGTRLVAAVQGGGIYTSVNAGANWSPTSAPSQGWYSVASSADGTELVAVANPGGIYTSADGGATWPQTGAAVAYWHCVASSSDGTRLAAGIYGGGIYTAQATVRTTTTPGPAGRLTGGQYSAVELQYIGNGLFLPLSSIGTLSSY